MSLEFILSSVNTPGGYIKDQLKTSSYYSGTGWFGKLQEIEPGKLYKIRSQDSTLLNYAGRTTDVNTIQIPVVSGWNWIGYLPQDIMPLNDALSSLSLVHLDYIKSQISTSTYYESSGWFGELKNMIPTEGYMLKVANAGVLKYPEAGKKADIYPDYSKGFDLEFNPYSYENNGSVTAQVYMDGEPHIGTENDVLYAFVGDELRGLVTGEEFPPTGAWLYSLVLHSNENMGELMSLGFYDSANDRHLICNETIIFEDDMVLNDALNPFVVNVTSVQVQDHVIESLALKTYPNPFENNLNIEYHLTEPAHIRITVFDVFGQVVKILTDQDQNPGNYSFQWNTGILPSATYYLRMDVGDRQIFRKVVLMK